VTSCNRDWGVDDESAPRACSVCGTPLLGESMELVRQPSGYVAGRLCPACAAGVRSVILDLDKLFIAIDKRLLPAQIEEVLKALHVALNTSIFTHMFDSAPDSIALRSIPIEEGDHLDELIIRLGGKWYRWSRLRESLDRLGG